MNKSNTKSGKAKKPAYASARQRQLVDASFYMCENEFNYLIGDKARRVDDLDIYWENPSKHNGQHGKTHYAHLMVIDSVKTFTKDDVKHEQKSVFGFYLRYGFRVYRMDSVEDALLLVNGLKIERAIERWEHKEWQRKRNEQEAKKKAAKPATSSTNDLSSVNSQAA